MMTYDNQQTVSTRDLAWSTAGTDLDAGKGTARLTDGRMTAAEALEKSGLAGWNVRRVPLSTTLGDHDTAFDDAGLIVPDQYANVATIGGKPKVLGIVGSRYRIFQNEETAELLDTIVDEGGAHFEAAGSLAGHRKTFVVMKMPKGILVGGQDATDLYLGVTNSHDGSGSLVAWATGVRLRCTNQLNSAVKGARSKWRLRHTSGIKGKVEQARESLELTFAWADEFQKVADGLLTEKFSAAQFDRLLDHLEPASKSDHEGWVRRQDEKRGQLRWLFNEADTNELGRGTKWGAYNAFTEYADWFMPIKSDDAAGTKRAARILDSAAVDNFKQDALDALVAA